MPNYLVSYSDHKVILRNYEGYITTYEEPAEYTPHDRSKLPVLPQPAPGAGPGGHHRPARRQADVDRAGRLPAGPRARQRRGPPPQDPSKWVPYGVGAIEGQSSDAGRALPVLEAGAASGGVAWHPGSAAALGRGGRARRGAGGACNVRARPASSIGRWIMASPLVIGRIDAWEAAGLIDPETADRLREAEADAAPEPEAAVSRPPGRRTGARRHGGRAVHLSRRRVRAGCLVRARRLDDPVVGGFLGPVRGRGPHRRDHARSHGRGNGASRRPLPQGRRRGVPRGAAESGSRCLPDRRHAPPENGPMPRPTRSSRRSWCSSPPSWRAVSCRP